MLASMSRKIREKGYNVYTASDGMEAFDIIEKDGLDLVISDIMMPELSGITLVTLLEQHNYHIPLIFITSLNHAGSIIERFGLMGFDVLVKPIDYTQLFNKIKHYEETGTSINL